MAFRAQLYGSSALARVVKHFKYMHHSSKIFQKSLVSHSYNQAPIETCVISRAFRKVLEKHNLTLSDEFLDINLFFMWTVLVDPDIVVDPFVQGLIRIIVVYLGPHEEIEAVDRDWKPHAWLVHEIINGQHTTCRVLYTSQTYLLLQ